MKLDNTIASRFLSWMLMGIGCGLMVAFFFMVLPRSQMDSIHAWLGLGAMPEAPIVWYLARSTSLLYGVHGALMFVCGRNINEFIGLAPVFGWLHVGLGLAMLFIDLSAGMPWWWTAFEGIPIAITGGVIVWLHRMAKQAT